MNKNILELRKVKKNFIHRNGIIKIFDDISLQIKQGDLVALVGPSGCGKSTFLNIISFLDVSTSGSIIFQGKNIMNLNNSQKSEIRKKKISMIFQHNNLLSDFTVLENVVMPLIIRNENKNASYKKAKNILKIV